MAKKRVGIIGMGVISRNYLKGLIDSKRLELVAVCDKKRLFATRKLFKDYPHYRDYLQMIEREAIDYAIIATPPATHYEIATACMRAGVSVILEKPAVSSLDLLKDLIATKEAEKVDFQVMYHWQTGAEVKGFLENYEVNKVNEITVKINDDYSVNGKYIRKDRVPLGGAWIDSGVNALSFIKTILPFDEFNICETNFILCEKTRLPMLADVKLIIDGKAVRIVVDWTKRDATKKSIINYDGREIIIDHGAQCVIDGKTAYRYDDMERLPRHYYGYFAEKFTPFDDNGEDDLKIHKILFTVRDEYEKLFNENN